MNNKKKDCSTADWLEVEQGHLVVKAPGTTIPFRQLLPTHPAIQFLKRLHISPGDLERQFRAEFCVSARVGLRCPKLMEGFKLTPKGRVIFYDHQRGVRVGWQAFLPDIEEDNVRYVIHPSKKGRVPIEVRKSPDDPWERTAEWAKINWPSSRLMRSSIPRTATLLGFDAAVEFNAATETKRSFCVLSENVIDAARLGTPAIACDQERVTQIQAELLAESFEVIVVVPAHAASTLPFWLRERTAAKATIVCIRLPQHRNNLAELTGDELNSFRKQVLEQARSEKPILFTEEFVPRSQAARLLYAAAKGKMSALHADDWVDAFNIPLHITATDAERIVAEHHLDGSLPTSPFWESAKSVEIMTTPSPSDAVPGPPPPPVLKAQARYYRLIHRGLFGICGNGDPPEPGAEIIVETRKGDLKVETVAKVLDVDCGRYTESGDWRRADFDWICSIEGQEPPPPPAPRERRYCERCRESVYVGTPCRMTGEHV